MKTADDIIVLGEELVRRYKLTRPIPVKVDDGGVGGGVVDRLRQVKGMTRSGFGGWRFTPSNLASG